MNKEIKFVEYVEAVDKEGFVIDSWTAFVKEGEQIRKEKKSFDWSKTVEETKMTSEQFHRLVSVR